MIVGKRTPRESTRLDSQVYRLLVGKSAIGQRDVCKSYDDNIEYFWCVSELRLFDSRSQLIKYVYFLQPTSFVSYGKCFILVRYQLRI